MTLNEFVIELKKLNITITEEQLDKLDKYYNLLIEWNEKINLTAITKKEDVYLKHFYDSITLYKIIDLSKIDTMCDIGTGAGFPGIVIKIIFPKIKMTLIDSLNKRINFLRTVIEKIELENVELIHARAEEYGRINREKFDLVTARALAPLNILLEYAIPLVKPKKYFIAMKGNIQNEIKESKHALEELNCKIDKQIEFDLPNEAGHRTLIIITKEKKTSTKYPRLYSEIKNMKL